MMGDSHRKKTHLNTAVREGDLNEEETGTETGGYGSDF